MQVPIYIPTVLTVYATLVVYVSLSVAVSASPINAVRDETVEPSNMYTNPPLKVDNIPKNIQLPVIPDSGLHFPISGPNPIPNRLENPNTALNLHPNPYMMLHPHHHTHTHPDADADTGALPPCVHSHYDTLSESPPSARCEDIGCTLGGPRHVHLRCKSLDIERSGMSGGEGGGGHTQFCARDTY